jgi:hypothetical protein
MKVRVGKKIITSMSRSVVAAHMAQILAGRDVIFKKEKSYKKAFAKNKELTMAFLKHNKDYIYVLDETWLPDFLLFQEEQKSLLMQEISFKFSDGSEWTVPLSDIANIRIMTEPSLKLDKAKLLENPVELAEWAQKELSWDQVKDFTVLRHISGNPRTYNKEWPSVKKQVVKYNYEIED